jgi:hypothetical protein
VQKKRKRKQIKSLQKRLKARDFLGETDMVQRKKVYGK